MKYELVKFVNDNLELEINISPKEETIWMNKEQIALLFNRDRTVISRHIKNLFNDGELIEKQVCAKNARTGPDGKNYLVDYYNLDVVIAVGYRVKSPNATVFRKWATNVLKEYLLRGYVIDEKRTLVTNENYINLINKVDSLEDRIRKIEDESIYFPKNLIIEENELFDAYIALSNIISSANQTIVLIDPYIDNKTLNVLKNKKDKVLVQTITSDKAKISEQDIKLFNTKYGGLSICFNNDYHDRYLIIDNLIFYHLGTSVNYLGNKFSQIDKIEDEDIKILLRKRIDEQK